MWLIFDNTAGGAAAGNALSVRETLEPQAAKAFAS